MGWFDYGRIEGLPSQYPPHKTPVTVDVLEAGFICAFLILAICCYVSLATPRLKHYGYLAIRVTLSLLIGLFIMLANFGQEWEVSHIRTKTPYRVGTGHEIDAEIGVKIGLRSVNVTLKSEPDGPLAHEIINYNERFEWTWDQGNFGFGPFAGLLQRQFRAAQYRGVPLPILWIIDYFVIDGEGYRFGRFYRTAGWYTHILIWTAFPCWLLAVILFRSVIRYGGYFLFLTGCLLILANITWSVVRNPADLVIPFEDAEIVMKYGFSYWLCLFTGLLCVALSITIIVIEAKWDTAISIFFGIDPLTYSATNDIQMNEMQPSTSKQHIDPNELQTVFLKRKTSIHFTGAIQRIRKASLRPREDQQPLYGNMETIKEESRRRMV
ncbi:hypothetical protein PPYR_11043 [Photinus pyralis]|uniref:Dual oxidase maturation factor 1 n=1 Tax=Photinus pyralis TaxID=7054 RepID=A0A5N4AI09_PHOPY|nr:hypothetical protein PPYR_11043 [Photinus pyralis]